MPELDQPMIADGKIEIDQENEIYSKTNMSEDQLRQEVANSGYRVFKASPKDEMMDEEQDLNQSMEVPSDSMSTRDAFFSLMAIKMLNLSQRYNRKLEDLHYMFYTVSCDWERLEKVLQDNNNDQL